MAKIRYSEGNVRAHDFGGDERCAGLHHQRVLCFPCSHFFKICWEMKGRRALTHDKKENIFSVSERIKQHRFLANFGDCLNNSDRREILQSQHVFT